jgi:hypothetical protein
MTAVFAVTAVFLVTAVFAMFARRSGLLVAGMTGVVLTVELVVAGVVRGGADLLMGAWRVRGRS